MKVIIFVALALVAVVAAAPADPEPVQILRSEFNQEPEGGYVYSFETGNGISCSETGETKTVYDEDNQPQTVIIARGTFTVTDPKGNKEPVDYFVDETGFHAIGPSTTNSP